MVPWEGHIYNWGPGREMGNTEIFPSQVARVYLWASCLSLCSGKGSFTTICRGKKRSVSLFWPTLAETTHKPLIATAKRELADMKLAQITQITILWVEI